MIWIIAYCSSVAGAFLTIVAMTVMRADERHNLGKIGWLALTLLSPPVGLLLFLWLGGHRISTEHRRRKPISIAPSESDDVPPEEDSDRYRAFLRDYGVCAATGGNQVRLLSEVREVRDEFLALIRSAKQSIFVMTFILDNKDSANEIVDALCQRAREGVEVRLLCDGFGSFWLSEKQLQRVRDAGGKARRFKPFSQWSRLAYFSFRNHRKLMVVDGRTAILGGANIVQDEMARRRDDESWVDLSLRIDGPAAGQMQAVFQSDWGFVTGETLPKQSPPRDVGRDEVCSKALSELTLLPIGPDGIDEVLNDFWQYAIHHAKERIWICTPYFVPPPLAMYSLEIACRRGIDVRVLVPDQSDLRAVDYARIDFFEELQSKGATILRYPDRMVHAKIGIVDQDVAVVGSANFDVRSFFLNYELSVAVHDAETIGRVTHWLEQLAADCQRGPEPKTWTRSVLGTMTRIFASEL